MILVLYDSGVRSAELCGMRVSDIDWRGLTILVTGKAGKQRRVSIGSKAAQAVEWYLRKRPVRSDWLWLASDNKPFTLNGLRMMMVRRFGKAGMKFWDVHAFRRGFAIRLASNEVLEAHIRHLFQRPEGELSEKPVVRYHDFLYQVASWDRARRVVAKITWHQGELPPRWDFIVSTRTTDPRG